MQNIFIFDDGKRNDLSPLADMHACADLLCGILTLREKIIMDLASFKSSYLIMVNGRCILDPAPAGLIGKSVKPSLFIAEDTIAACVVEKERVKELVKKLVILPADLETLGLPKKKIKARFINYPWDFISLNGTEIADDTKRLKLKPAVKAPAGTVFVGKSIFIGKNCSVESGVVLDSVKGPVVIDDGARIMANSVIYGPAYIGKGSTVKALSKIYGGTSIGPSCKVGGEIEQSVFLGYSNKQHEGFLGHSYICEWVNLGAGTNNSDLKNNYKTVEVTIGGKQVDTEDQFVGAFIGDHVKTGIGTMINTGTVIGAFSNLFGAGYMKKTIPPFSWGGPENFTGQKLEKAIETAKAVMKRRGVRMSRQYEDRIRQVFEDLNRSPKSQTASTKSKTNPKY